MAADHPFLDAITWLAEQGITTGYADGTFRPSASVTRQAMAAYLYRMAGSPDWTAPVTSPFTDVATDSSFYAEITWLAAQGITAGYPDGGFHPTANVSRQATSAFLFRYAHPGQDTTACGMGIEAGFSDVDPSLVFCEAIRWMASVGPEPITTGYGDGTFRPTRSVTRQAMAAYLYRYVQDFPAPVDEVSYAVAEETVVPAAGTVLSAAADSGPVPVDQDGAPTGGAATWSGQVVLSAGANPPAVGTGFVIPPDTESPYPLGVWGTVAQATANEDGTTTLTLAPTALDQVYDHFTVDYAGAVDTASLEATVSTDATSETTDVEAPAGVNAASTVAPASAATRVSAASTPGLTCTDDAGSTINDGISLQVKLRPENTRTNYRVNVGPFTSDPFVLVQVASEIVVSVSGKLDTGATCKLTNLPTLTTIVGGGATLTLGPYVEFELDANASLSMSQRIYVTTGFWARNGQTHRLDGRSADPMELAVSGGVEMTLGAGLKVTFGVGIGASVGLYGSIGPEISASVTASVTTGQTCTDLEIYAEVQVNLVIDLGVYLKTWVKDWEQSLIQLEVPLWEPDPWCLALGDPGGEAGGTLTVGPLQLSYDPADWSDAVYGADGPGGDSMADDRTNDAPCTNCTTEPAPMVHAFVQVWSMSSCANLQSCITSEMPEIGPAPTISVGGRSPTWSARVAESGGYLGTAFAWCFEAEHVCVMYRRGTDSPQLEPSQAFFDLMDTGVWVS